MTPQSLNYEKLNEIVELANYSDISSIGTVVSGIIRIINDPKSTIKDLKEIIQVDPPLTARVLRLANSSYYSPPKSIGEIMQAIIWVGYDAIKELAMSQKVCKIFDKDEYIEGYSRKSLWKHSLAVALLAKMVYRKEFGERGENIYASGLLHDFGFIVLDQFCQEDFSKILGKSKEEEKNVGCTEDEVLGFNHGDLGMAIVESWNIPEDITMAIGNHHKPQGTSQGFNRMVYTLYAADYFCQEKGIGYGDAPYGDRGIFHDCLSKLGLGRDALELIMKDVESEMTKMEDQGFFSDGQS
ncbi:MAG: HDOD domain-containing protein [Pseudomonadota bacterium]